MLTLTAETICEDRMRLRGRRRRRRRRRRIRRGRRRRIIIRKLSTVVT
jgi:hypothetical protein